MSVVRLGEDDSDVYIYVTRSADLSMSIMCCELLDTPAEMLEHVKWHRLNGDHVPSWVDHQIFTEWDICL